MDVGRKAQKIDQLRREPNRRRLEKCQEPSIEKRLVTLPGPREARCLFEAVSTYRERPERMFDKVLAPAMATWSDFAGVYARYRRFASAPALPVARTTHGGISGPSMGLAGCSSG